MLAEDVELCDMVQRGLESRTYERGVLNSNENGVLHLHNLLREAVPGAQVKRLPSQQRPYNLVTLQVP